MAGTNFSTEIIRFDGGGSSELRTPNNMASRIENLYLRFTFCNGGANRNVTIEDKEKRFVDVDAVGLTYSWFALV